MIRYIYNNSNKFFLSIYILFLSISLIDNYIGIINYESYIEIIQVLLLLFNIFLIINKKTYKKIHGYTSLILRLFITSLLIFEELSWLSKDICNFCSTYNVNGELNLHNSLFFEDPSFSLINAPIIGTVSNNTLLISIILLLLSIGNLLPLKNKFLESIFLNKKIYYFGLFFIFDKIIYWILIILGLFPKDNIFLMHIELMELFLYILFTFDLLLKLKFTNIEN